MTAEQPQSPFDRVLQAVFPERDRPPDPAYAAAEADLEAYIEMQLDGKDADDRYPHVGPALDRFEALREAYASLSVLLADERTGLLVAPATEPGFDLSFIQPATRLWEQAGQGGRPLSRLAHEIQVRLGRAAATFGPLPPALTPRLVTVPIRADEQAQAEALDLDAPTPGVAVRLQLGPTAQEQAVLSIRIEAAHDAAADRRARVTLLDDTGRMLISANADRAGWVTFRDIEPGRYVVRITDENGVLELPLSVSFLSTDP